MNKNEQILPFIRKEELKKVLYLNETELKELLATFNIQTDKQLTKKTVQGILSYLDRIKKIKKIDINKLPFTTKEIDKDINLEEIINNRKKINKKVPTIKNEKTILVTSPVKTEKFINPEINSENECIEIIGIVGKQEKVIDFSSKKDKTKIINSSYMNQRYELYLKDCEKNRIKAIPISIYKNFKDYPIESSYIFDKEFKDTILKSDGLRKIIGPKKASKIYNNGYVVYYVLKNAKTNILCKLDITKPFSTNLSLVSKTKHHSGFDFYTKGEQFDISQIENTIANVGRIWTEEEDKKILDFYNSSDYADASKKTKNKSITLKELANEFGVYPGTIRSRATQLGFTNFKKPKEPKWSNEELELLKKCTGKYNPKKISKIFKEHGFTRSFVAIAIKLKRSGFSLKLDGSEEINLKMLSDAMGVDSHFFYDNNRLDKLNARRENNQIIFEREDIATYLKENPYDYSLAKVEPKWFIEILTAKDKDKTYE